MNMDDSNETAPSEFILLAFSNLHEWRFVVSGFMLTVYIFTLMGNSLIIFIFLLGSKPSNPHVFLSWESFPP